VHKLFYHNQIVPLRIILQQLSWLDLGRCLAIYSEDCNLLNFVLEDTITRNKIFCKNTNLNVTPNLGGLNEIGHACPNEKVPLVQNYKLSKTALEECTSGEELLHQFLDISGSQNAGNQQLLSLDLNMRLNQDMGHVEFNIEFEDVVAVKTSRTSFSVNYFSGKSAF